MPDPLPLDDLFDGVMKEARQKHVQAKTEQKELEDGRLGLGSDFDFGNGFDGGDPSSNGQALSTSPLTAKDTTLPPTDPKSTPVWDSDWGYGFSRSFDENEETVGEETFRTYTEKRSFRVDVIGFCERFYYDHGELPKYSQLHDNFADYEECPRYAKNWKQVLEDVKDAEGRSIQDRLEQRGLPTYKTAPDYLEPQFITACHLVLNVHDKRSTAAKLKDVGVSSAKWNAWLKRKAYHNYYREHSKKLLETVQPEVERALVELVQSRDLQAIKYVDERTGEYRSQENNGAIMAAFMQAIFSVLARNVDSRVINVIQAEIRSEPAVKQVLGELIEATESE